MSFLRRIEFLEPGKNPILSDMGLSFGKEMMRIDAHTLDTPELHLYVNRVLPSAIAHSPYQRLSRKWSAFDTAAPERRMAAKRDALLQAEQDRLLDGRCLRLRVGFVEPTSARRLTIRHSRDFDMKAAQHSVGMFINGCSSAGIEIGMRSPKIHIGAFFLARFPDTMADP
jgi:hypothetical protein